MRRLGKQRIEALMILEILLGKKSPWERHPAIKMWRGWEPALYTYGTTICREWISRGYKDTRLPIFHKLIKPEVVWAPKWLDDRLCASHRSNLLRKNPDFYGQYGWIEPNNMPYYWPV